MKHSGTEHHKIILIGPGPLMFDLFSVPFEKCPYKVDHGFNGW